MKALKSIPFFEALNLDQLLKVEQTKLSEAIEYAQWIIDGDWKSVINNGMKHPDIEFVLMKAHALGKINSDEIATALMFIDIAMNAPGHYKLFYKAGVVQKNLRYEIRVNFTKFREYDSKPYFEIKNLTKCCPSFPFLQERADEKFGLKAFKLYPVFGLSDQDKMPERFEKRVSDFALVKPGKSLLIHEKYLSGFELYNHDLAHLDLRSTLTDPQFKHCVQLNRVYTKCLEQLPPMISAPFGVLTYSVPMLERYANKADQQRYLYQLARGNVLDGGHRPNGPLTDEEIEKNLKIRYQFKTSPLYFNLAFMDKDYFQECVDTAISLRRQLCPS